MKVKEAHVGEHQGLPLPADAQLRLRSLRIELEEAGPVVEAVDPNVGGGVDRKKLPAGDFAGKNRSFPIVTPKDVADAAVSIGRAGDDNYSPDQLKANIIRIAKRKGAAFVARLPKAWAVSEAADDAVTEAEIDEAMSYNERQQAVRAALKAKHGAAYVYVVAMYDNEAVYRAEMPTPPGIPGQEMPTPPANYYRAPWAIDDAGVVTIGDAVEVRKVETYEPVADAGASEGDVELLGDYTPFLERALDKDGTFPMKIIAPVGAVAASTARRCCSATSPTCTRRGRICTGITPPPRKRTSAPKDRSTGWPL